MTAPAANLLRRAMAGARRLRRSEPLRLALETAWAERDRWPLWSPVCLGLGIGLYLALPFEPRPADAALAAAAAMALGLAVWRWPGLRPPGLAVLLAVAGFALGMARTHAVAAPVVRDRLGPVALIGRVVAVAEVEAGYRVTLDRPTIAALAPSATPARVRVTVRGQAAAPVPGDWVQLSAILLPPTPPQEPGAYDFARQAYFQRLGAVGFATRPPRTVSSPEDALDASAFDWRLTLAEWRHAIARRLSEGAGGAAGAIAAALIAGERGAVPEEIERAMQDSGLAHLLSISGLHLAFAAGLIFFLVRFALAAVEPVALAWPVKKIAAAAAILAAFAYMMLSGAAVPTQRSFITTAIVLLAVIVDRAAISLRLIAIAALIVLATQPESLFDISFQMSFAAVIALVAVYEAMRQRLGDWRAGLGPVGRGALHLGGVAATTLIAGFATAPFAAYHFNRFVDYGLVANLIAVPLTGFVIMPLGLLALILMPFGLEGFALWPMGRAIDLMVDVARTVAGWPGAVLGVPAMPDAALLLTVGGGLWLCLWRRRWRLLGLLPMAVAGALHLHAGRPDLLVDQEGRLLAVRRAAGGLAFSDPRAQRLARETWVRRDGEIEPPVSVFPASGASEDGRLRCDRDGCIYRVRGARIALLRRPAALEEDCRSADVVIAPSFRVGGRCSGPRIVIDRDDLRRDGAHAVRIAADGQIDVATVAARRGRRPWSGGAFAGAEEEAAALSTGASGRPAGPARALGRD